MSQTERVTYAVIISILLGINIWLVLDWSKLHYEKTVYNWKFFTCRTLLDDPATRAIMDATWRRGPPVKGCKK